MGYPADMISLNLAIVHYHLNRGGVTQVITNQLLALDAVARGDAKPQVALLYGGRRFGVRISHGGLHEVTPDTGRATSLRN